MLGILADATPAVNTLNACMTVTARTAPFGRTGRANPAYLERPGPVARKGARVEQTHPLYRFSFCPTIVVGPNCRACGKSMLR